MQRGGVQDVTKMQRGKAGGRVQKVVLLDLAKVVPAREAEHNRLGGIPQIVP